MKKMFISPFTKDECPIIRHRHMVRDYDIVAAVPEKGYGLDGKDVCALDGGESTGFILRNPYNYETPYDVVLSDFKNKETVVATYDVINNKKLNDIPIPIVMVMGLGINCQKFDIQLGLREAFQKEGYKVSQFGTKDYSWIFGFDTLPYFENLSLWKKVFTYNSLFYNKYKEENPDVMIIGIPGEIMPITSYSCEKFGETALAVAFAAKPDITVLSCYFTIPTQQYFDSYKQFMRFRFGATDVVFHMSNTNLINDNNKEELGYLTLESQFALDVIKQKAPEFSTLLFNTLVQKSANSAYRQIIEKLQKNVCLL